MERLYRAGRHFKGDGFFTVKGKHKDTGETQEIEIHAADAAAARESFRQRFDDAARPYRYKLRVSQGVVGLGRRFTWESLA